MTLSDIQLDFYYVESLRWKLEPEYEPGSETQISLDDLQWNVERMDGSEDGRTAAYRLTLCLPPVEARYPYSFEIVVVGNFALSSRVPQDRVAPVLDSNAPTMLYSMAREALATAMGRGPFRALLLPSVHFMNLTRETPGGEILETPDQIVTPVARRKRASKKPQLEAQKTEP